MEQPENKQLSDKPGNINPINMQSPENEGITIPARAGGVTSGCGGQAGKNSCEAASGLKKVNHIYAIGRVNARFPTMAVEKEFAQATGRAGKETAGLTNHRTFHSILKDPDNRYLIRQLCWVLTIEDMDTYILKPRDPADLDLLVKAVRPAPSPMDIDIVIGIRGPIAPPDMCNGLMVPIVIFDQIYSFDRPAFVEALKVKRPESIPEEEFAGAAEELFDRIMQMADNAGATDEHRALNYLAVRYDAIYANTARLYSNNCSLTGVDVRPSRLSSVRKVVDVIFSYTSRVTDVVEKYFVRVDVTEEFPFLVTKMSPYYDR